MKRNVKKKVNIYHNNNKKKKIPFVSNIYNLLYFFSIHYGEIHTKYCSYVIICDLL